ncbi:MAG: ribosome recycling factor [Isosphaeraceae bacterium]
MSIRRDPARSGRPDGKDPRACWPISFGAFGQGRQHGSRRVDSCLVLRFAHASQADNPARLNPQQILIRPFDLRDRRHRQGDRGQRHRPDTELRQQAVRLNASPRSRSSNAKLVGRVKDLAEGADLLRNIRRDANKQAEAEQGDKQMTEDELETCKEEIQSLLKRFEGKVNDTTEKKSEEILEV